MIFGLAEEIFYGKLVSEMVEMSIDVKSGVKSETDLSRPEGSLMYYLVYFKKGALVYNSIQFDAGSNIPDFDKKRLSLCYILILYYIFLARVESIHPKIYQTLLRPYIVKYLTPN